VTTDAITNAAIVGLAAGTTSRELLAVFPNIEVDGIEIDPLIVDVGNQYFAMQNERLNVIIQDGRWALENSPQQYDIISVDAYRPPYIPWHMTTVEFFQIVFDHLDADGVMVINVGRAPTDRRLVDTLAATIQTVFPTIYISDLSGSFNTLIFASKQQTSIENFRANFVYLLQDETTPPLLLEVMAATYEGLQPIPAASGLVFTDDRAPVEHVTNSIILSFILSGESESLE
jgi:spermidine synthase